MHSKEHCLTTQQTRITAVTQGTRKELDWFFPYAACPSVELG